MINKLNVNKYCCEDISLIENYEKAVSSPEIWDCHHRMVTHRRNGTKRKFRLSTQILKDWNIYYNRPASELIFLTHSDHTILHSPRTGTGTKYETRKPKYGKLHSKELSEGLSKALKGKTSHIAWNKGLKGYSKDIDRSYCHSDKFRNSVSNGVKKVMNKVCSAYKDYKSSGGTMTWNEFQREFNAIQKEESK